MYMCAKTGRTAFRRNLHFIISTFLSVFIALLLYFVCAVMAVKDCSSSFGGFYPRFLKNSILMPNKAFYEALYNIHPPLIERYW